MVELSQVSMVQLRDWIPGVSTSNTLSEMSAEEIDHEARQMEGELNIMERNLQKLDAEFRQKINEAAQAPSTQKDRLKLKAKQKKREYEQKEAGYQQMLQEYMALLTVKNAKERLKRQNRSSLSELSQGEINEFKSDIKDVLIAENQQADKVKDLDDTIDTTLTALTEDFGKTQEDNELDDLIEKVAEGEQNIDDISVEDALEGESDSEVDDIDDDILEGV